MKVIRLGLGVFGVAVAATVLAFGLFGFGVSSAAPGPGGPGSKDSIFRQYKTVLAQKLNVSLQTLEAAEKATRDQLIDQAVAAGKLTKAQGDALKSGKRPTGTPGQGTPGQGTPPQGQPGQPGQGNRGPGGMRGIMSAARDIFAQHDTVLAQKLGISVPTLDAAQKAARDQLIDQAVAAGKLTKAQADALKSGKRPGGQGGPGGPGGAGRAAPGGLENGVRDAINAAATTLKMTPQDLQTALRNGQSLAEIAQSKGVGRDALRATIMGSVQNDINAAIRDGKITAQQGTQAIEAISKTLDRLMDQKLGRPGGANRPGQGNNRPGQPGVPALPQGPNQR